MAYYFENGGDIDWEAFHRERQADYEAIGRAGALLFFLKKNNPVTARKFAIMSAGEDDFFPLYAVRKAGFFGSKPIPGFTRGRMVEVVEQLKEACGLAGDPNADALIDELAIEIEMFPLKHN